MSQNKIQIRENKIKTTTRNLLAAAQLMLPEVYVINENTLLYLYGDITELFCSAFKSIVQYIIM